MKKHGNNIATLGLLLLLTLFLPFTAVTCETPADSGIDGPDFKGARITLLEQTPIDAIQGDVALGAWLRMLNKGLNEQLQDSPVPDLIEAGHIPAIPALKGSADGPLPDTLEGLVDTTWWLLLIYIGAALSFLGGLMFARGSGTPMLPLIGVAASIVGAILTFALTPPLEELLSLALAQDTTNASAEVVHFELAWGFYAALILIALQTLFAIPLFLSTRNDDALPALQSPDA